MEKRLFDKKSVIAVVTVLFLFIVCIIAGDAIVGLKKKEQQESGKSSVDFEDGQDSDVGLQVKDADDGEGEDLTDASGSWEDDAVSAQTGDDGQNNSNTADASNQDNSSTDGDNRNDNDLGGEDEKDILIDDKTWGPIF